MHIRIATAVLALLAACSPLQPRQPPSGHLGRAVDATLAPASAPPAATPPAATLLPPPGAAAPPPATVVTLPSPSSPEAAAATYSVAVHDLPLAQLLLAIGRDAGLELDLHPDLEGRITLNAIDQPLARLLERIAEQAEIRYRLEGRHLVVRPDTPFVRSYMLDYVNLDRDMRGTVATSTQIATSSAGARAEATGNASITQIETRAGNSFWSTLEANLNTFLDAAASPRCAPGGGCSNTNVIINRESGVLMVRATARQHEQLADFLGRVQEAARRQVMIEATVVEITLADGYRQGIDWSRLDLPGWTVRPRGSNDGATAQPTIGYLSARHDVRIELLETFGTVKVLSSPRLSVLNNQTAMLKVVEEVVYFIVDSTTTEYDDRKQARITATTTPQSVSVGMVMAVTPQISAGGDITLNVRPTIAGISGFKDDPNPTLRDIPNRVPQIRTREIESMLRLRSGEIAVLGGLMEDRIDHDTGRIPIFGHLPLLGELFTRRDSTVRRTELLIFLRPVLIDDPSTAGDFTPYAAHLPAAAFFDGGSTPAPRPAFPASGSRP